MLRRRSKPKKPTERVVEAARTNPAVPVAGALGMTMLGAALMRRRKTPEAH